VPVCQTCRMTSHPTHSHVSDTLETMYKVELAAMQMQVSARLLPTRDALTSEVAALSRKLDALEQRRQDAEDGVMLKANGYVAELNAQCDTYGVGYRLQSQRNRHQIEQINSCILRLDQQAKALGASGDAKQDNNKKKNGSSIDVAAMTTFLLSGSRALKRDLKASGATYHSANTRALLSQPLPELVVTPLGGYSGSGVAASETIGERVQALEELLRVKDDMLWFLLQEQYFEGLKSSTSAYFEGIAVPEQPHTQQEQVAPVQGTGAVSPMRARTPPAAAPAPTVQQIHHHHHTDVHNKYNTTNNSSSSSFSSNVANTRNSSMNVNRVMSAMFNNVNALSSSSSSSLTPSQQLQQQQAVVPARHTTVRGSQTPISGAVFKSDAHVEASMNKLTQANHSLHEEVSGWVELAANMQETIEPFRQQCKYCGKHLSAAVANSYCTENGPSEVKAAQNASTGFGAPGSNLHFFVEAK
jgi:hypothetical protein